MGALFAWDGATDFLGNWDLAFTGLFAGAALFFTSGLASLVGSSLMVEEEVSLFVSSSLCPTGSSSSTSCSLPGASAAGSGLVSWSVSSKSIESTSGVVVASWQAVVS